MQGMASSSLVAVAFGIGIGCYIAGRARKAKPKDMRRVDKKLVDKDICIVTGGSRGIGAATCLRLQDMYKIVCVYNNNKVKADEIVKKIKNHGNTALAVQCNISDPRAVKKMFGEVERYFKNGKIVALVNNAAIIGPTGSKGQLLGMPKVEDPKFEEQFLDMMKTNVLGPLSCSKLALEKMSKENGGAGGAIVNISSGSAFIQGSPVLYAITKGALNSLQSSIVTECAKHGIRINTIAPGMCNTDMPSDDAKKRTVPHIPLKRLGEASEIADAICYLLSKQSSYVCGANIRIAGGRPMGCIQ